MKVTQKIMLAATVVFGAIGLFSIRAFAQATDYSKVEIKTSKLANNFYMLEGQGGTIGVLAGPDGVFMVDDEFAPLSQKIVAAVKQVSDQPIRFW